jgi:hypothetical protein
MSNLSLKIPDSFSTIIAKEVRQKKNTKQETQHKSGI